MRVLFGLMAVVLGLLSVALTARYGYKGADTELDATINAAVFGTIALCAFLFDGAAVRLWFGRHFAWSTIIGFIACAALVVTITNSLGGIAGRADVTQAERGKVASARAELRRLVAERDKLPAFVPADDSAVRAAQAAVTASERARASECDKRGPECRKREGDEAASRAALLSTLSRKALTERAAELDGLAAAEKGKLANGPTIENVNPLGHALELMIGAAAATLTAWQQAAVAIVFELCLVGVMVIYELLGQEPRPAVREARAPADLPPKTWGVKPKKPAPIGAVAEFLADVLEGEPGSRIEVPDLYTTYKAWCAKYERSPHSGSAFVDQLNDVRKAVGLDIEARGDKVYCMDVRLAA